MNNLDLNTKEDILDINDQNKPQVIQFRCPECSKLYQTNPLSIYVDQPEFSCTSCDTEFSISLFSALVNKEVIGKKIPQAQVEDHNEEVLDLEKESPQPASVGVIQDLKKEIKKNQQQSKKEEESEAWNILAWKKVLNNYASLQEHLKFIALCTEKGALELASERYSKILQANPNDLTARECLNKIMINGKRTEKPTKATKKVKLLPYVLTAIFILIGVSVIGLGHYVLESKNTMGLGLGLIFFTFAVRAVFHSPQKSSFH